MKNRAKRPSQTAVYTWSLLDKRLVQSSMSREDIIFIVIVILLMLIGYTFATVHYGNLLLENMFLKEENYLLKTTIEDFGTQIEELLSIVNSLKGELENEDKWNRETLR